MAITYRDGVFIAVLIIYVPALVVATYLMFRHGIRNFRSSVWRFVVTFALIRVLTACFQLATIASPTNYSLYVGYVTLISIAISVLECAALAFLRELVVDTKKTVSGVPLAKWLTRAQLFTTVGLILGVAGGILTNEDYGKTGVYKPSSVSKVSIAFFIVSFAVILLVTVMAWSSTGSAGHGRLVLMTVAFSLPFLLVRIIYSAISIFANAVDFSAISGSVTTLLCMALIEEIVVVVAYEAVGLVMPVPPKHHRVGDSSSLQGEEL